MKTRPLLALTLAALVIAALVVVAFRTDPVPVDLATVRKAHMQVTVDVEGKTRVAEIYEVAAPIRGTARRSPVRVGDSVTAGSTVVAILEPAASDPLDPRSRVQAEAAVREAEAGLHLARSTLRQAEAELQVAIRAGVPGALSGIDGRVGSLEKSPPPSAASDAAPATYPLVDMTSPGSAVP